MTLDPILDLAASVADNTEVDWEEAESSAPDEDSRKVIRALGRLAQIGGAHQTLHAKADRVLDETTLARDPPENPVGSPLRRWGHLEVLEKLGAGAFGDVYRARDTLLDRQVALKLLRLADGRLDQSASQILKEGQLLARIDHPHVVTVYGADQHNGQVGLWMELVEGRNLSEILRQQGAFGAREAMLMGIDLCRALAAVHAQGVLHRDVKAQNVMRREGGRILLMDFGVGRDLHAEAPEDNLSGTPLYLPPEVLAGEAATPASDLYSLSVMLYHLVTERFPIKARSLKELRRNQEKGMVVRLRDARPDLPGPFVTVVEQGLTSDPGERFASAGEMEAALRAALSDSTQTSSHNDRGWQKSILIAAAVIAALALVWALKTSKAPVESLEGVGIDAVASNPIESPSRVLLGRFANNTSDESLDEIVREVLDLALSQSQYSRLLPLTESHQLLASDGSPKASIVEIMQREGVSYGIRGVINPSSPGWTVLVELHGSNYPADPTVRREFSLEASDGTELVLKLETLSVELRRAIGEPPFAIEQRSLSLSKIATDDFEALRHYAQARDHHAHANLEAAILDLNVAKRRDPEFALAYYLMGICQRGLGKFEEEIRSLERAYSFVNRVSPRERLVIEASYHQARLDYRKALDMLRQLVYEYPWDDEAQRQIALHEAAIGDLKEAIVDAREAVRLNPSSEMNYGLLVILLAEDALYSKAATALDDARRRHGDHPYFHWGEGLLWLGRDNPKKARHAFSRLAEGRFFKSRGQILVAQTLVIQGQLDEATAMLEEGLGPDLNESFDDNMGIRAYLLAQIHLLKGRPDLAKRWLEMLADPDRELVPKNVKHFRNAVLIAVELGEAELARQILYRLVELENPSGMVQDMTRQIQATLDNVSGNDDLAEQRFFIATQRPTARSSILLSAARFHVTRKNYKEALGLYDTIINRKGSIFYREFSNMWVLAQLERARCLRALDRDVEAHASYSAFLRLWGSAKPRLELVEEARIEAEALANPDGSEAQTVAIR